MLEIQKAMPTKHTSDLPQQKILPGHWFSKGKSISKAFL